MGTLIKLQISVRELSLWQQSQREIAKNPWEVTKSLREIATNSTGGHVHCKQESIRETRGSCQNLLGRLVLHTFICFCAHISFAIDCSALCSNSGNELFLALNEPLNLQILVVGNDPTCGCALSDTKVPCFEKNLVLYNAQP